MPKRTEVITVRKTYWGTVLVIFSLRASPTVFVELKFPVELNSSSNASRVCEPANEVLFFVTCRFRKNTEQFNGKFVLSGNNRGCTQASNIRTFLRFLEGKLFRKSFVKFERSDRFQPEEIF